MKKPSYVYILASARYGTLYTGVTTDIIKRTWQHKGDFIEGFTKAYGVHILVWYENTPRIDGGSEARKADQALETCLESGAHYQHQPDLARPL